MVRGSLPGAQDESGPRRQPRAATPPATARLARGCRSGHDAEVVTVLVGCVAERMVSLSLSWTVRQVAACSLLLSELLLSELLEGC
jgi:hypothetical protein